MGKAQGLTRVNTRTYAGVGFLPPQGGWGGVVFLLPAGGRPWRPVGFALVAGHLFIVNKPKNLPREGFATPNPALILG